jgi:hypothetical protein
VKWRSGCFRGEAEARVQDLRRTGSESGLH